LLQPLYKAIACDESHLFSLKIDVPRFDSLALIAGATKRKPHNNAELDSPLAAGSPEEKSGEKTAENANQSDQKVRTSIRSLQIHDLQNLLYSIRFLTAADAA